MKRNVFILLVMISSSCFEKPTSPTYGEVFFSDESKLISLFEMSFPQEDTLALYTGWQYLGADSIPGMEQPIPEFTSEGEAVTLPHKLVLPNHSLWYSWKGNLDGGVLFLDGDDGAQLWVNGERVLRSAEGEFYRVEQEGEVQLTVRVINNAVSGGLKKAFWMAESSFLKWMTDRKELLDSLLLNRKIELLTDSGLKAQLLKIDQKDRVGKLADYPIMMTEPIIILDSNGEPFLRWQSEKGGESVIGRESGEKYSVSSKDGIFTFPIKFGEVYKIWIQQGKSLFGPFHFNQAEPADQIRLAIWGDSQGGWKTFKKISHEIASQNPDFSLGLGDLVNNGSQSFVYSRFLQVTSQMNAPQILIPGNHDYDGFYEDLIAKEMERHLFLPGQKRFGFQILGSVGVLALDPNVNFPVSIPKGTEQQIWMDSILTSEAWSNLRWKVIAIHQPPYSQGWPGYHGELSIRETLEPYFHRGLIDFVIAGHTHDYERLTLNFSGNSVHFLIVGGAGGGLEPKDKSSDYPKMDRVIKEHHFGILDFGKDSFNLRVFNLEGEIIDQFIEEE